MGCDVPIQFTLSCCGVERNRTGQPVATELNAVVGEAIGEFPFELTPANGGRRINRVAATQGVAVAQGQAVAAAQATASAISSGW